RPPCAAGVAWPAPAIRPTRLGPANGSRAEDLPASGAPAGHGPYPRSAAFSAAAIAVPSALATGGGNACPTWRQGAVFRPLIIQSPGKPWSREHHFPVGCACRSRWGAGGTGESETMWRVFWVPQDAVRTGIRPRVLAGGENLPARGEEAGGEAGDPILLSPGHQGDPLLSLYFQSAEFRRYRAETRRNYTRDIALLLTFLWGRDKAWTDAGQRDLEDYEHWRRFATENPARIGGTKWDRELAAFISLYKWAVRNNYAARSPVAMRQVRDRDGNARTVAAVRAKDARPSNVHWLTPRAWRRWIDIGLRGHGRDGVPEAGWASRVEDRNAAFTRLLVSSGLRRAEGGSMLTFEVPARRLDEGRYYWGKVAAEVTRSKKD